MGPIDADSFAVWQAAHVLPHHFLVTEARPPVLFRLLDQLLNSSLPRCNEERLASHRVVVRGLALVALQEGQPRPRRHEGIATVLCVVPIKAANPISRLEIAPVQQVLLARLLGRPVSLLAHELLRALNRILLLLCHQLKRLF